MIISFRHKGLEKFFREGDGSKLPPQQLEKIRLILSVLDTAEDINDIRVPGFDLHKLVGKMAGLWAVKVNGNYRIVFDFNAAKIEVYDVNHMDYH